jgi:hypothetical protein
VVFSQEALGVAAGLLRVVYFVGIAACGAASRCARCLQGFDHERWQGGAREV